MRTPLWSFSPVEAPPPTPTDDVPVSDYATATRAGHPITMDAPETPAGPKEWQQLIDAAADLVGTLNPLQPAPNTASPRMDLLPRVYELQGTFERPAASISNGPLARTQPELQPQLNSSCSVAAAGSQRPATPCPRAGHAYQNVMQQQVSTYDSTTPGALFAAHSTVTPRWLLPAPSDSQRRPHDSSSLVSAAYKGGQQQ